MDEILGSFSWLVKVRIYLFCKDLWTPVICSTYVVHIKNNVSVFTVDFFQSTYLILHSVLSFVRKNDVLSLNKTKVHWYVIDSSRQCDTKGRESFTKHYKKRPVGNFKVNTALLTKYSEANCSSKYNAVLLLIEQTTPL